MQTVKEHEFIYLLVLEIIHNLQIIIFLSVCLTNIWTSLNTLLIF